MKKIAILDTTNFVDFPIGGQLSSIKNFLKYCYEREGNLDKFILIGITIDETHNVGEINKIYINNKEIEFFPVAYVNFDENSVNQSLRKLYIKGLFEYIENIKKVGIDKYYIHSIEAFLPIFLKERKKEKILFSHGNFFAILDFLRFGSNNNIFKYALKTYIIFAIKASNKIYVLDKNTLNQYQKYTNMKKIQIVKNSIDIDLYNICESKKKKGRSINLLFVGRLSKNKGVLGIIESLKYIDYIDYHLNIVGAGEELNKLEEMVSKNRLTSKVSFLGKKTGIDLINIYNDSDILIMNSCTEGTPMVILEAMASSIPTITTPVGNIPNIIKENYNGEYTDGTPKSIGNSIHKVINNIDYYKKNSYKESLKYSYKEVNKDIYEDLNS